MKKKETSKASKSLRVFFILALVWSIITMPKALAASYDDPIDNYDNSYYSGNYDNSYGYTPNSNDSGQPYFFSQNDIQDDTLRRIDEDAQYRHNLVDRLRNDNNFRRKIFDRVIQEMPAGQRFVDRFENDSQFRNNILDRLETDAQFRHMALRRLDQWSNSNDGMSGSMNRGMSGRMMNGQNGMMDGNNGMMKNY